MKKLLSVLFAISVVSSLLWLSRQPVSAVENIRVAQDHLLKGNYAEAIQLFETLSEGSTDRHAGRSGLLQACLITGQYERVEELAQRFLKEQPNEASFQIFIGKSELRRGKYAEALQAFESAFRGSRTLQNEAQLDRALLLEAIGRLEESQADFSALYQRAMNTENPRLGFAAIAAQHLGRYREANALFKRATASDPNDHDVWIAWGNLFLEKYNPKEAASVFADVLKVNPRHPEALVGIALSRGEDQGLQVQEILRKALEINPNMEQARVALAGIALESEAFEECEKELQTCLKTNPKSLQALAHKALLAYARGQEKESLDLIQEVLLINPHYAEVYLGFATFCVTQRLYQQSVDYSQEGDRNQSELLEGLFRFGHQPPAPRGRRSRQRGT